ncbi:MAG TPA: dephospho-CoA kinase [Gaiellaceae bacterium]|nr:dephospho-CoA kinase [Gaiellaceae bacterium]
MTGGIGAGKSEALAAFARHGAAVLSSDEIVHRLLRADGDVKAAVRERFGAEVVGADGEIDRARVAEVVFADPDELHWLEQLLHPRVMGEYREWRQALAERAHPPAVCAVEVPLLYEVGAERLFDAVVAVTAPAEVRASRLGRSVAERERRLIRDEEKLERADFAYVNDGTLADLDAFVAGVVAAVTSG